MGTIQEQFLNPPDDRFHYQLHGCLVSSNLEMTHSKVVERKIAQIDIHCIRDLDSKVQIAELEVSSTSYGAEVRIPDIGIFTLTCSSIHGHVYSDAFAEPYVQGRLLALALELGDHTVLHGAALSSDRHSCFGILGSSGSGKSTLSAHLLKSGFDLLTDDLIPIFQNDLRRVVSTSSHLRLWKDSATAAGFDVEKLEQVHPVLEKYWVPALNNVPAGESR
ncbi:MAG: hypothetical protein ABGY96_20525, partial [bacterium]